MAANQRENERKAKHNQKKRRKILVLWIIIAVIIAAIAILKICEIDFSSVIDSIGGGTPSGISETVSDESKFPYQLSAGENTVVSVMGNKIAILNDTDYTVINSSNAQEQFRAEHGYANPIAAFSSGYSVLIDQGANSYRLDSASGNIYENSVSDRILCADVSDTGIVALATVSGIHKSTVAVYSKSLNTKISYEVSGGYITSVAVSGNGKYVAFSVLGSDNARIVSTVYTMSVNDEEPRAKFSYTGSSVLDLHFSSKNLYIVGSDFLSVIKSLDKETHVYEQGDINTVSYCYNSSDNLVLAYGEYVGAQSNIICCVKPSGKIKTQVTVEAEIRDVTASGSVMTVLTDSKIISYKIRNGKESKNIAADETYTAVQQMSSKIFAKHGSVLELVND